VKFLEILGTIMGICIVVFPLSAIGMTIYEFSKPYESRSFFIPIILIVLFILCSIGLIFIANILQ
ncbi:hypothetical protein, partial [Staphylococcus agnetis]|uniref:hypothetical protein n=1 Tax=Staphylococcus agnetis TaxID=985762 RepID=UPI001ADB43E2